MIKLKIKGKNFPRFLKRLKNNNINIYKINKDIITVSKHDLEKIEKLKTIYEIEVINRKINYSFLICIFITIILLYINSKIIYKINIITDDINIRNILKKELNDNNIKIHKFKLKDYENIEKKIINNNKSTIEWLEIENVGNTLNIRVQNRIIKKEKKEIIKNNIIAKKDAIIKKIDAKTGVILKDINSYVNKGDIIITNGAVGEIYGEVWYKTKTEVPYVETKKKNQKGKFKIVFNKDGIFSLKCMFLPIKVSLIKEKKQIKQDIIYTKDELVEKALNKSKSEIEKKLGKKEYIIYEKQLKQTLFDSKIEIEMFYAVYENITDYSD